MTFVNSSSNLNSVCGSNCGCCCSTLIFSFSCCSFLSPPIRPLVKVLTKLLFFLGCLFVQLQFFKCEFFKHFFFFECKIELSWLMLEASDISWSPSWSIDKFSTFSTKFGNVLTKTFGSLWVDNGLITLKLNLLFEEFLKIEEIEFEIEEVNLDLLDWSISPISSNPILFKFSKNSCDSLVELPKVVLSPCKLL